MRCLYVCRHHVRSIIREASLGNIGNVQFKVAKDPNFRPTIFDFSALGGGGGGGKVVGEGIAHAKELENKREFVELMKKINSKPEKNNISDPTISLSTNLSSNLSSSSPEKNLFQKKKISHLHRLKLKINLYLYL